MKYGDYGHSAVVGGEGVGRADVGWGVTYECFGGYNWRASFRIDVRRFWWVRVACIYDCKESI